MEGDDGRESLDAKGSRGTEYGTSRGHPAKPSTGGRRTPAVGTVGAGTRASAVNHAKGRGRCRSRQTPHRPGIGAPAEGFDAVGAAGANLHHRSPEPTRGPS